MTFGASSCILARCKWIHQKYWMPTVLDIPCYENARCWFWSQLKYFVHFNLNDKIVSSLNGSLVTHCVVLVPCIVNIEYNCLQFFLISCLHINKWGEISCIHYDSGLDCKLSAFIIWRADQDMWCPGAWGSGEQCCSEQFLPYSSGYWRLS